MKKSIRTIIALTLSLCLLLPLAAPAFAAQQGASAKQYSSVAEYVNEAQEDSGVSGFTVAFKKLLAKFANFLSNLLINGILGRALKIVVPDSKAVLPKEDFKLEEYGNFYPGMDKFLTEPAEGARWSLGYGSASVLPPDFGTKPYSKGAYLPYCTGSEMYEDDEGCKEDLRVRVIVMDDNSGRGKAVFIALDAIGFCNRDVRIVREALKDIAEQNNIVSINISCTHIHTGIDAQGVWTDPIGNVINNASGCEVKFGVDRTFLQSIVDGSVKAVKQALADMKTGRLYYSSLDIGEYVHDRTAPISNDPNLYKLEFVPDDEAARPTIIATFGCHPESSSYDWKTTDENGKTVFDKKFSADFIWYMEKIMNSAGYNFIYLQGNVCTVTSSRGLTNDNIEGDAHMSAVRYGYELGYITLTLSMTQEERAAVNDKLGDKLGVNEHRGEEGYTVWYEGLASSPAKEVEPYLNIASRQFFVKVDNNVVSLIGKTSAADNLILKDKFFNYYTVSEVGYLEIGGALKVYLSPGETFSELRYGGSGAKGFPLKPIAEQLGEDVIIMDLVNDAAGYVANPANFAMVGVQYNEAEDDFDDDTWCIISYGKGAAEAFISNLYELVDSVK